MVVISAKTCFLAPSVARVYDFLLGGKDHYAVDREVAQQVLAIAPDAGRAARANRAFLRRAVRHLVADAGIRQFIDLGSGLPARGNVHEIAHSVDPGARVVYVDNDPMVVAHNRALLADDATTTAVHADVVRLEEIVGDPEVRRFIDFDEPVGVLLFAVLHHVREEDDPAGIAATLRRALPSGSHLALSHFHNPAEANPEVARQAETSEKLFVDAFGGGCWRSRAEILDLLGGFDVLEPGVVPLAEWRPDPADPSPSLDLMHHQFLGAVARKP
ncbi:SAM-dependent methyltransferase [Saccharopolyspora erythraea]|uniref:SAM-dependent methyltransferase n=1 Tax=Saccharopolyspora erythraea TaxID=1836 RepID=UPI001BF0F4EA|nr:SAM-dependent methyltransferase [Saccharopolyspora erythraea]QUH02142.1 SAM-dependent methyltransferase [Saccharopolyspora erythraea]